MMMKSSVAVVFLCTSWLWLLCCICILPISLASVPAHNTEAATSASAGAPSSSSTCLDSQQQQQQHEHGSNNEHEHNACVGVESSIPRGGGLVIPGGDGVDIHTKDVILRFIESAAAAADDIGIDNNYPFHIQGWRWHFLSLIRDVKRLERLANHLHLLSSSSNNGEEEKDGLTALEQAANYAINFNMAGLFRIESNMFVPFLREHLCQDASILGNRNGNGMDGKSNVNVKAVASAFRKAVDAIDAHRVQSEKIGKILYEKAKAASSKSSTKSHQQKQKQQLLHEIANASKQLSNHLSSMRSLQETLIVPAISHMVPPKVQKSFNNKVLLNLGLLESRLHLVGMHDAVWELGVDDEKIKFENEIPYMARMMIERWRLSLYIPKAGALDYGLTTV